MQTYLIMPILSTQGKPFHARAMELDPTLQIKYSYILDLPSFLFIFFVSKNVHCNSKLDANSSFDNIYIYINSLELSSFSSYN